jgi:cytochrome d ubiquinol oxidase subunit II
VLAAIAIVSVWTPLADARIAQRWFTGLHLLWFSPAPIAGAACALWCFLALRGSSPWQPFVATLGLFASAYLGIAISLWPLVVPPVYTLRQAAADPATQAFLLTGTLVLLPVILGYTGWSYWVFRGKVKPGFGYH